MSGLMSAFWHLVRRDLQLAWKEGGTVGVALGFYLVVVTMLPLSLGPDLNLLSRIAPGLLWVALLLATLLSLGRLFETDFEDGSLEVLATSALPLEAIAAAKSLAHWLTIGIPLTILAPVLGLLVNLPLEAYGVLVATMLAGTPAVSFIGAIGAALTLRARRGGVLIALLMLPLFVPTLLFGIEAVSADLTGSGGFLPAFLILVAISLASIVLAPLAAALALRFQLA
jgi:heme exporter protein B